MTDSSSNPSESNDTPYEANDIAFVEHDNEVLKPNRAHLRLWRDALRSGAHIQGTGHLEYLDNDGKIRRCCLGVACRVAMAHGLSLTTELVRNSVGDQITVFNVRSVSVLPPEVAKWLGINDLDPFLVGPDPTELNEQQRDFSQLTATELNDQQRWDFSQIADAITQKFDLDDPDLD